MSALLPATAPQRFENDLFLRAFTDERLPRPPLWLMRQAGRYLPEYRATRARAASFMEFCRSPALCAEVVLQPIERFGLDAAILFSDILTIPDAMGLGLSFESGEGPRFAHPLREESAIARLAVPPLEALRYVFDALRECKRALTRGAIQRVPLIGFSGSPFTLACYMIEGGGSEDEFPHTRRLMHSRPDLFARIIEVNTEAVSAYLLEQAACGADCLMVFDSWGGLLSPTAYRHWSLASLERVVSAIRARYPHLPLIVFSKGAGASLAATAAIGADAVGVDWQTDLCDARARVGSAITLQGNFDPVLLTTDEATLRRAVRAAWAGFDPCRRYIANLGHGITPEARPELVAALVAAVAELARTARA
ncbi:MAG: uroporphyrinogen decarboxylase [Casimicrobiaceae bacterium]|nr:uroporphyrinogen decarboxylase [Casimicrobiaceae bacterium]MCX8099245.1 uroporphyrinogen decarboxylase [Casimicrobiaceae bacterium]MDW8312762.1 uroporphyrinogen decarboxylase [Burkholderiales bacterium]